jgi:hypothetical protein
MKTDLQIAVDVCRNQEYLLNRQQQILNLAIKKNNDQVAVSNQVEKENAELRRKNKKLIELLKRAREGHWTNMFLMVSALTDRELKEFRVKNLL